MRKNLLYLPFSILLLLSCSDDADEPVTPPCENKLGEDLKANSYVYTGDVFTLTSSNFCHNEFLKVLVNDVEVDFTGKGAVTLTFIFPQIDENSATLKIKTATGVIDLERSVDVFPGNGVWTEVAPFPAVGRWAMASTVSGGKAYVSGGSRSNGWNGTTYTYEDFGTLFQFDPTVNTWSTLITDDRIKNKPESIVSDNKLFLFPYSSFQPAAIFDLQTQEFSESGFGPNFHFPRPFVMDGELYLFVGEVNGQQIYIKKYNPLDGTWSTVKTVLLPGTNQPIANFAFVYDGLAYVGLNLLNSTELELWTFDPATTELLKISTLGTTAKDFPSVEYLFVKDGLAYFMESGTASSAPAGSTFFPPASKLHIYNFQLKLWRTTNHTSPEGFHRIPSFSIDGRLFAGLGVSSGTPGFTYSSKFYEFTPK